ncbi:hypothetical protein BaRGS_00012825 [Batillaria attramentaria]|uniref:Uncharacterized protein n=1 Tax=Batillaria attramentaria TaxID=370345 RepID=A0ABD0L9G4_9CAEN
MYNKNAPVGQIFPTNLSPRSGTLQVFKTTNKTDDLVIPSHSSGIGYSKKTFTSLTQVSSPLCSLAFVAERYSTVAEQGGIGFPAPNTAAVTFLRVNSLNQTGVGGFAY